MNMVFQFLNWVMIIGIGHEAGFSEVPKLRFMRNMPAMFIPDIAWPACSSGLGASCAAARFIVMAADSSRTHSCTGFRKVVSSSWNTKDSLAVLRPH